MSAILHMLTAKAPRIRLTGRVIKGAGLCTKEIANRRYYLQHREAIIKRAKVRYRLNPQATKDRVYRSRAGSCAIPATVKQSSSNAND